MTSVELRQVEKSFAGQPVLSGLDLRIESGSYVVLLGPSGCGKTTTLRVIAGLEPPDRGEVRLGDQSVRGIPPRARDVAMVFQHDALYPHLTVGQALRFALPSSLDRDQQQTRIDEAVALTGIGSILDRYPSRLSGGELRRAAIAKAITRSAAVRLLDEPLSALDIPVRQTLQDDILRWHATVPGTSIHVTHDGQEAMRMADLIAVMDQGRIVQFDQPSEVFTRPVHLAAAKAVGSPNIHLLPASIRGGVVQCDNPQLRWRVDAHANQADAEVLIGVRPDSFRVVASDSAGDAGGESDGLTAEAELLRWQPVGRDLHLRFKVGPQDLLAVVSADSLGVASISTESMELGQMMRLTVPAEEIHCFDATSGCRIDLDCS